MFPVAPGIPALQLCVCRWGNSWSDKGLGMSSSAAKIRVLVVDRDPDLRLGLAAYLGRHPYLEVIGTAAGAQTALPKIAAYRPDWVVIDLAEDPTDGLGMLEVMQEARVDSRRAVITGWAGRQASKVAAQARACGVAAVVRREAHLVGKDLSERLGSELLTPILRAAGVRPFPGQDAAGAPIGRGEAGRRGAAASSVAVAGREVRVVGIGVSTGGPVALNELLPKIPETFPVPIVVVQHMPPQFTKSLAASLDKVCALRVREMQGGEPLVAGQILIAPGGRHAKVRRGHPQPITRVTDDPPECSCRPSVDYLFRSLASTYGRAVLGVMLTGMGEDGWLGSRSIHDAGGSLLAQDEASSAVYGMPRGPIEAGLARAVPLSRMAQAILEQVGGAG